MPRTLRRTLIVAAALVALIAMVGLFVVRSWTPAPPPERPAVALSESPAAAACRVNEPLRQALFGDLHVHTSLSSDAWMFDVRVRPTDAYRYATGGEVLLSPIGPDGRGTRPVRIDRPLDFAAVTDHSEFLGEGRICLDPAAPGYASSFCDMFRQGDGRSPRLVLKIMSPWSARDVETCGPDGEACLRASSRAWQEVVDAAEAWNDTSDACSFTTFVGYEYSSHRLGSNLHRNVIFRNAIVPPVPISYLEAHREWELWEALRRDCIDSGTGCDVLAIPHNSNISNGRMFAVDYPGADTLEGQRDRARLRMRVEPVVEIMQHKGDSECRKDLTNVLGTIDELCDFEKFEDFAFDRQPGPGDVRACSEGRLADAMPHLGPDCVSPLSYVRGALIEGLAEEKRIGVNPFKFGITASTDTHNGLAGGVEERTFPGHLGRGDDTVDKRVRWDSSIPGNASNNPGGLIGVWAEENSRESIFEAIRRREVFGTSGPRIQPRFFGAWDEPQAACGDADLIAAADAAGVPMGADLPPRPPNAPSPVFVATALADPGADDSGARLQRLQIVKGWVDEDGRHNQRIFDVAGAADRGADVDLETCTPRGPGDDYLCAVFRDPEFDPDTAAVYYARAVENPTCRYSTWQCLELDPSERPPECGEANPAATIQERAWTSPIWYTPPESGA